MNKGFFAVGAILSAALFGCSVKLSAGFGEQSRNECTASADCSDGVCRLGACVAEEGSIDTVLLEVTPPTTAAKVGGTDFLQVAHGFSKNRDNYKLTLHVPASVKGYVLPYDLTGIKTEYPALYSALASCSATNSTLPVKVTLIPREQILGLPATTYVSTAVEKRVTDTLIASHPCGDKLSPYNNGGSIFEFSMDVPAGDYDVYVEASDVAPTECRPVFVPELVRAITVEAGDVCLPIAAVKPKMLDLDILWPSGTTQTLDDWAVDLVHPVTGHVLSPSHTLVPAERTTTNTGQKYHISLPYSVATGDDYALPNQELVRLTPPNEQQPKPVIQLEHSVLDATTALGQAVIGNLAPFPPPVQYESYIWKRSAYSRNRDEVSVAATVTLTATKLRGIDPGIFASFSTTVDVKKTDMGQLSALLLPGEYRARIVPYVGSGLAATELTFTVPCAAADPLDPTQCDLTPTDPPRTVEGRVMLVPNAADVTGRAVSTLGGGLLDGAVVQGLAAQFRSRRCDPLDSDAMAIDAGASCSGAPLDVLELALGEDQFVPRTVTTLVGSHGNFTLADADCGQCEPNAGASFDVFVQPRDGSGLAWLVQTGVTVESSRDLGSLELPLPIVQRGIVQVPRPDDTPARVPGALIRAYIFRDDQGAYVADADLPSCASRTADGFASGDRCIRSVLQVAETRTADDGSFRLFIPASVH